MKSPLAAALMAKGKGTADKAMPEPDADDAEDEGGDEHRALMVEAAEDGDWEGFVDALCEYVKK